MLMALRLGTLEDGLRSNSHSTEKLILSTVNTNLMETEKWGQEI